tara:strand:- start:6766 stop:7689 length:924 start_codon:yes stop_codon:yes gene_type:complete
MADPMQAETEEVVEVEVEDAEIIEESNDSDQPVVASEPPTAEKSDESEIADYSESVKKRINKLTYKIRESERREQAAIEYAKNVQQKLNNTQASLSQKDKNLYDEYSARVESQLASAEDRYKKAHDLGETDDMLSAQKDVATLAVELESLNRVKPTQQATEEPVAVPPPPQQQMVPPPQPQMQQPPPQPDAKAQDWATKNEWFGNDLAMTTSAFAFHRQLVEQEGFDPASDDYYQEVDRRMAEAFPHKLRGGGEGSPVINVQENVANSSRGARGRTGKGRTVKLSPSQVAIAKRLGVSLEDYAKHVK